MATAIIGTLKHLPKASILPTLPETGRPNRIYFIPNEDPTEDNRYNEYLWVKDETYPDGHWELVGPTTIDLTIGDTTVNLFPNIFKLFKAGKVSTSESLSIELTANPGVSGVPQVPTSLCQWSIPLADSNTAGIISSEDKAKLDNLSDPKNLLAYGVEWDSTNSSPVLTRIGNMSLHKSLPIQSALRGCVCQGKRIMYYLDPNDWSKKADGTDSRLDGYDGTVQVEVPEFYLWSETEGTKSRVYVSTQKVVPYAIRIPHMLVDAYRSTVLNEVPEDMGYLSTLQVNSAISVVNTSSYCRGGNNSSSSDTYLESDKFRTNLGKPRTNTSRANFRTYAKNAGKMLLTYKITQVFYKHKDNKE